MNMASVLDALKRAFRIGPNTIALGSADRTHPHESREIILYRGWTLDCAAKHERSDVTNRVQWMANVKVSRARQSVATFTQFHGALYPTVGEAEQAARRMGEQWVDTQMMSEAKTSLA
jgi:hypothetical protein